MHWLTSSAAFFAPALFRQDCSAKAETGTNDVIQLSRSDFTNFSDVQKALAQSASGATITLDANDQILLYGAQASSLTASEFKFD